MSSHFDIGKSKKDGQGEPLVKVRTSPPKVLAIWPMRKKWSKMRACYSQGKGKMTPVTISPLWKPRFGCCPTERARNKHGMAGIGMAGQWEKQKTLLPALGGTNSSKAQLLLFPSYHLQEWPDPHPSWGWGWQNSAKNANPTVSHENT